MYEIKFLKTEEICEVGREKREKGRETMRKKRQDPGADTQDETITRTKYEFY